jgi:predicted dehydrogenase
MDAIHWALGHDAPLAMTAMGGKVALDDNREIPDTLEVLWTYPGGTLVTFSQYNATAAPVSRDARVEIEFRGTKGTLLLFSDGYEIVPDEITPNEFPARTPLDRAYERGYRTGAKPVIAPARVTGGRADTSDHARNFLDCIRSRAACACDIETGHRSTSATLIGNIAHKTRSYLEWDRETERFTNSTDANAFLTYRYRAPHVMPEPASL